MPLDTFNKFGVGVQGGSVVILMPKPVMSPRDALLLAAYLVTMAQIVGKPAEDGTFADWLEAVQST